MRKQIAKLQLNDDESVRGHMLRFEDLERQLRMIGSKLEESDVCSALMHTLPESFDPLVTGLENLAEADLTYKMMKTRLLSEDSKRMKRYQINEEKPAPFVGNKDDME